MRVSFIFKPTKSFRKEQSAQKEPESRNIKLDIFFLLFLLVFCDFFLSVIHDVCVHVAYRWRRRSSAASLRIIIISLNDGVFIICDVMHTALPDVMNMPLPAPFALPIVLRAFSDSALPNPKNFL